MLGFFGKFFKKKGEPPVTPPPVSNSSQAVYSLPAPSPNPHVQWGTGGYVLTGYIGMSGSYINPYSPPTQEELKEKAAKFKKFSLTPPQNTANI